MKLHDFGHSESPQLIVNQQSKSKELIICKNQLKLLFKAR